MLSLKGNDILHIIIVFLYFYRQWKPDPDNSVLQFK